VTDPRGGDSGRLEHRDRVAVRVLEPRGPADRRRDDVVHGLERRSVVLVELDAAFGENEDPIAGVAEKDFERLYQRIVSLAPDPVGLGERWKKKAG